MSRQLRMKYRYFGPQHAELSDVARNTQEVVGTIPVVELVPVVQLYAEPMYVALSEEPYALELARIVNVEAPEDHPVCSGMVHWVWEPQNGGARIDRIEGMTTAAYDQTRFKFFYRVTYALPGVL